MSADQNSGFLILQSDWNSLVNNVANDVWIAWKNYGRDHSTKHGNIIVKFSADGKAIADCSLDNVEVEMISTHSAIFKTPQFSTKFFAPLREFRNIHQKSITALDISCGGGLGVSVSVDGSCKIWDTFNGTRILEGHFGDVQCCKFFPSGLVVLTGGMDTQLKIWSAEDGQCARTLNGSHKGAVLCIGMIERGRNIVSGSRDGTLLLWECGSGSCIGSVGHPTAAVNSCCIADYKELSTNEETTDRNQLEAGTEGKVIALSLEDGCFQCYALHSRSLLVSLRHTAAINTCCFLDQNIIVVGAQDGSILVADIRSPSSFIVCKRPSESRVLCVSRSQDGVWVACGDGRCSLYKLISVPDSQGDSSMRLELQCELTGPDCDPVYAVAESSDGMVYTACRDGIVRKYKVK